MSRWIDADKELKELKNMKVEGETFTTAVNFAIMVLENAPSIDLVRCAECKYHEDFPTGRSPITCSLSWGGVFENDFCSYGERKESE